MSDSATKARYRLFSQNEPSLPVFSRDWWLDAVAGDDWDAAVVEDKGQVQGALPFCLRKVGPFLQITMPPLTQKLGPWLRCPVGLNPQDRLSFETRMIDGLLQQCPKVDRFYQRLDYSTTNWLPFYWQGFDATPRYTYVLDDIRDPEAVFSGFHHSKRKNIRRSTEKVEVRFNLPAPEFYENHRFTLAKQGKKISYPLPLFQRVCDAVYRNQTGCTICAFDAKGNIHSGLFVIWDHLSAYDLISTIDPDYRNSGSSSLLVWEMIKHLSGKTVRFDFEGSMVKSVERSFRRFGAEQRLFFALEKVDSPLFRFVQSIRYVLGRR
ncbi:GNAT family N-acetyltransferase [bacterium]|nr:GNAT family N-acetyltransferase [bacterium]